MTQTFPTSGSSSQPTQNIGEGIAWLPPSAQMFGVHRYYSRRLAGMADDTLDFNPKDERELARARGLLTSASASGAGGSTTPVIGRAAAKLIPEAALIAAGNAALTGANLTWVRAGSSNGQASLPIPGWMPSGEFTVLFFINPRSADLVTANANQNLMLFDGATIWQQQLIVNYTAASTTAGTLTASLYYYDFTQNLRADWQANLALAVGDFPAATGSPICVSFDSTGGLILTAGSALKQQAGTPQNSPVASRLLPWWGTLWVPNNSGNDNGIDITFPQCGRYSNNAALFGPDANAAAGSGILPGASWRFCNRPKITVNAASTTTAWPKHLAGAGNKVGNNLTALQSNGCPLVRFGETDDQVSGDLPAGQRPYATISTLASLTSSTATQRANGGGGTIGGTAIGINWANFDAPVLALLNAGIDLHVMVGYVPTALQGAAGRQGPPASNSNFALWASAILGRYQWLQAQATGGGKIVDASFWNEPDSGNGEWNSTLDQQAAAFSGVGTVGAAGAVTGFVINGSQAPVNGMGVYVSGGMGAGVPTISSVAGTGPYSFTVTPAPSAGSNVYMRGLPALFAATYLAVYQQWVSDQAAAGNNSPFPINGADGPGGHAAMGSVSSTTSTQNFMHPWWEACAYAAKANSLTVNAMMVHDYGENSAQTRGTVVNVMSALSAPIAAGIVPRVTEWGLSNVSPFSWYLADTPANWDDRWIGTYGAAYIHAYLSDRLADGVDMGVYFDAWGITAQTGEFPGELFDLQANSSHIFGQWLGNGAPVPPFYAFALLWKHHYQNGFLTSPLISPVTTNWPNLRALCSVGTNASGKTVVTLTYSSFRPAGGAPRDRFRFDIDWTLAAGLPTNYTWKQWHVDDTARRISRIPLIAQDQTSNAPHTLPYEIELDWLGVGCIQIVGT